MTLTIALLGMLFVGGIGIWQLNQAQQRFDYVDSNIFPSLKAMSNAQAAFATVRINILKYMTASNNGQRHDAQAAMIAANQAFDTAMADYSANDISSATDQQLLDTDKIAIRNYRAITTRVFTAFLAGRRNQATRIFFVESLAAANTLNQDLTNHSAFNYHQAEQLSQQNRHQYRQSMILLSAIIAIAVLASGLLAAMLFRHFTETQLELEAAALSDPLTGCMNRRHLLDMGDRILALSQRANHPMSVMFLDIDHFKSINDRFGHVSGDAAILSLTKIMLAAVRKTDIVGRIGGEEFVIILPDTAIEGALVLAERLRAEVAQTIVSCGKEGFRLTVSIGLAEGRIDDESIMTAIDNADKAMYQAKNQGRNRVVVASDTDQAFFGKVNPQPRERRSSTLC